MECLKLRIDIAKKVVYARRCRRDICDEVSQLFSVTDTLAEQAEDTCNACYGCYDFHLSASERK